MTLSTERLVKTKNSLKLGDVPRKKKDIGIAMPSQNFHRIWCLPIPTKKTIKKPEHWASLEEVSRRICPNITPKFGGSSCYHPIWPGVLSPNFYPLSISHNSWYYPYPLLLSLNKNPRTLPRVSPFSMAGSTTPEQQRSWAAWVPALSQSMNSWRLDVLWWLFNGDRWEDFIHISI